MSDKTPVDKLSFEDALRELEQLVVQLERGDVPLTDSITLYERGAALKARCESELAKAETKIGKIKLDGDGTPTGVELVQDT